MPRSHKLWQNFALIVVVIELINKSKNLKKYGYIFKIKENQVLILIYHWNILL